MNDDTSGRVEAIPGQYRGADTIGEGGGDKVHGYAFPRVYELGAHSCPCGADGAVELRSEATRPAPGALTIAGGVAAGVVAGFVACAVVAAAFEVALDG